MSYFIGFFCMPMVGQGRKHFLESPVLQLSMPFGERRFRRAFHFIPVLAKRDRVFADAVASIRVKGLSKAEMDRLVWSEVMNAMERYRQKGGFV
ncbi:MAG: hypothetical protein V1494_05415 [Candidatus Diapherotrites archaeon]